MISPKDITWLAEQPTPFYYYDLAALEAIVGACKLEADKRNFKVHYAVKANAHPRILEKMRQARFGADCVSGNEVKRALECGFGADEIVFAGVGKSDAEINRGLEAGIFCFNCESIQELEVLNELAAAAGKVASIALRINPDVDARTHRYITTGLEENKFGINTWELPAVVELLQKLPHLKLSGLHFHIGSQITSLEPFRNLCTRVNEIQTWFAERQIEVEHINVGGGLGVDYTQPDQLDEPDFATYFKLFEQFLEVRPSQSVHFELGRALVAKCGDLISRVLYVKHGINTSFAILDAGMTELIRPALYQSFHSIQNLSQSKSALDHKYDVVGPICESSDCFGKAVMLPVTSRGDLLAIRTTGAYGEVMASSYNLRERPSSLFSEDSAF